MPRFFLDQDASCHWYLVPVEHREKWCKWSELDPEDERTWEAPAWAIRINTGPQFVTFAAPELDGVAIP